MKLFKVDKLFQRHIKYVGNTFEGIDLGTNCAPLNLGKCSTRKRSLQVNFILAVTAGLSHFSDVLAQLFSEHFLSHSPILRELKNRSLPVGISPYMTPSYGVDNHWKPLGSLHHTTSSQFPCQKALK